MVSFHCGFLERLLEFFHSVLNGALSLFEDTHSLLVQEIPRVWIAHAHVRSHALDHDKEISHASINVGKVGVGLGSEHVGHLRLFVFFDKVPNLFVGAQWHSEIAFLVLLFASLERINDDFVFVSGTCQLHLFTGPLLIEILLNRVGDLTSGHLCPLIVETLEKNEVLNVLQDLAIDASEGCSTRQPEVFPVLIVFVVVLPDPSPTIFLELPLVERFHSGLLDDLRVDLDFLLALLLDGLWDVEDELLFFFLGESKRFSLGLFRRSLL